MRPPRGSAGRCRVVAAGGLAVLLACGCGSPSGSAAGAAPVVSAEPTLLPDGSVPWVDEPASQGEFDIPPPAEVDRGDAEPCRAEDLTASLAQWGGRGDGSDEEGVEAPTGLIGSVRVDLAGDEPCTLQGRAAATLRVAGRIQEMQYNSDSNDEGLARVTVVTPASPALLRLDWSRPYCLPAGPQELLVELPGDGGSLVAPVLAPTETCGSQQPGPEFVRGSILSASPFDQARASTVLDSPLNALRVSVEQAPVSVRPGQEVRYVVRLTNPTDADVALAPCPGYLASRFVLGVEETGYNVSELYRLNCRPVGAVPAQGSVAFQMRTEVPADPPGGPDFNVGWRLVAPRLSPDDEESGGFRAPIDY